MSHPGTTYILEVNPSIPAKLKRLKELAGNLWYSWDRSTRDLFARLDPVLWSKVGSSPTAFLRRIGEARLKQAVEDQVFLASYNRVLSAYDAYHSEPNRTGEVAHLEKEEQVAYFCFEFGFHESFPIYSGGLGILAADHCKGASDMRLPFVAVGMLYRQGYFSQHIDNEGAQLEVYTAVDTDDLPIVAAQNSDGSEVRVAVELPGRSVAIKVWWVQVGHVRLYLLDTDLEENSPEDRVITHQLYGGDRAMRIRQEIVLGVGGVRALRQMGIKPTIWHINEGHSAFMILERTRQVMEQGQDFATAWEAVAVNTVFTTHTPVPAGHDHFSRELLLEYFRDYCRQLKIAEDGFFALGRDDSEDFDMTAMAIRGSRYRNGVSRIHGGVSARICADLWPQVEPEENPVSYITNGIHVPTFLAPEWAELFDHTFGQDWRRHMSDAAYWEKLYDIPDDVFWATHQSLKSQLLHSLHHRLAVQNARNYGSEAHLDRMLKFADPQNPNVLTFGFARRFATYKRATLLFEDLDWLRRITQDADLPVLFIFAGKAHPADQPGQQLIAQVHQISRNPEFEGRVLLVEGYDLGLARRLVAGCDVWLNTPTYPLEASGTSGMKAGINGVLNLSVLDGWWGEGYNGKNGWAIKPSSERQEQYRRDREDSRTLYELLQDQVIPQYYNRMGFYSSGWVKMAKHSIASLLPRFNAGRMVGQYVERSYQSAARMNRLYAQDNYRNAQRLAAWKRKVYEAWPEVRMHRLDQPKKNITYGETIRFEVALNLNGLLPQDVAVEKVGHCFEEDEDTPHKLRFQPDRVDKNTSEHIYVLDLRPELCGKLEYRIRAFPQHELLTHPLEMGLMQWL
jgi:starch phosphorylase